MGLDHSTLNLQERAGEGWVYGLVKADKVIVGFSQTFTLTLGWNNFRRDAGQALQVKTDEWCQQTTITRIFV